MVARVESLQEFVGKLACGSGEHLFVDCCGHHSGGHCCVHNAVCDPVDLAGETEDCCALCCLTVCVCECVCVCVSVLCATAKSSGMQSAASNRS